MVSPTIGPLDERVVGTDLLWRWECCCCLSRSNLVVIAVVIAAAIAVPVSVEQSLPWPPGAFVPKLDPPVRRSATATVTAMVEHSCPIIVAVVVAVVDAAASLATAATIILTHQLRACTGVGSKVGVVSWIRSVAPLTKC